MARFAPTNSSTETSRRTFLARLGRTAATLGALSAIDGGNSVDGGESAPKTPRTPVVDSHMHVWSDGTGKFPFAYPYGNNPAPPKAGATPATAEILLEDMDANDVTHSVLVQVIYHGWDNTYIADCVQRFPNRFRGHGLIDPTDPGVADKLEYWMTEHGLHGMRFSAIYYQKKDEWMTADFTEKLWQKAAKLGAVFNFFIASTQLPTLEVMLKRHPEVATIIDHVSQIDLGAPTAEEDFRRLVRLARYPNVYVKVSELASVSASKEYPFGDAYPWVKRLYEAFGGDHLLWGTGYPGSARAAYNRTSLANELELIRTHIPCFRAEDRLKILGGNAARVWKLSATGV